jgi:predicted aconitase with swiveling domain
MAGRISFKGRVVVPAEVEGEVVVSRAGLNWLATYQKAIISRSKRAIGGDHNNPDVYNVDLTGKILVIPQGIGSTTGGIVLAEAACMGIAPKAVLCAATADTLTVSGVLLASYWFGIKIGLVDRLGEEVLNQLKTGDRVRVHTDGTVERLA